MAATPASGGTGEPAPDFRLPATDGRTLELQELRGEHGTVIVFMCNHCPYVKAIIDNLIRDARELAGHGVSVVAINANDAQDYPEDGFAPMKAWAEAKGFPFPYLHDESQAVARAYRAVCTPDFFGYDAALRLRYRGRLDDSGRHGRADAKRELVPAMIEVARTGHAPEQQTPSIGCSIKWKG